jgi:glutamyl-tRNA reductase
MYETTAADVKGTRKVVAKGNVVFMSGPERLSGDALEMDLGSNKGTFENAQGFVSPGVQVEAGKIERIDAHTYKVKDAYFKAREINASGRNLNNLFEEAIRIGKKIRTETGIGKGAVSVSTAAIELARRIFESLEGKTVLIIGAGKIGEMTVKNLASRGVKTVVVANRTYEKAQELAGVFGGNAIRFDEIASALAGADIVISSTSAPHFILGKEEVSAAMKRRNNEPLFLIDLGLPRNIDPAAHSVGNAYVYNIDDLAQVRDANIKDRMTEARKAEKMIDGYIDAVLGRLLERNQ